MLSVMLKVDVMGGCEVLASTLARTWPYILLGCLGMLPLKQLTLTEERCATSFRAWESKNPLNGSLVIPEDLNL